LGGNHFLIDSSYIFWDYDGPILDVSNKYYEVYKAILIENSDSYLTKSEFWNLKRNKEDIKKILELSQASISFNNFRQKWISKIETSEYLAHDELQPEISDILEASSVNNKLVMVTLRRSRKMLLKQLENLGLISYFDQVFNSGENIYPRWKIKYNIINQFLGPGNSKKYFIIGDTETDIIAGTNLGFTTIAVSNGIRNKSILRKLSPTYLVEELSMNFLEDNYLWI